MKRYVSIPLKVIIGLAVLTLGYFAGLSLYYYGQQWFIGYVVESSERQYEDLFRADTAGGATPEETWNLFIAALEQGNITLAADFFYLETRAEEKDSLQYHVDAGTLSDFVEELKSTFASSKKQAGTSDASVDFVYTTYIESPKVYDKNTDTLQDSDLPSGEYEGRIQFVKNEVSNVWKIYSL